MDCEIEWSTAKVEHTKLSVGLEPAPDFEFMVEFDRLVDPLEHAPHHGWGSVVLAHGHVVVSDVRLESAQELRTFLDETVREANRLAADARTRAREQEQAQAVAAAQQEAVQSAAAQTAAEHDARLTDTFRRSP